MSEESQQPHITATQDYPQFSDAHPVPDNHNQGYGYQQPPHHNIMNYPPPANQYQLPFQPYPVQYPYYISQQLNYSIHHHLVNTIHHLQLTSSMAIPIQYSTTQCIPCCPSCSTTKTTRLSETSCY